MNISVVEKRRKFKQNAHNFITLKCKTFVFLHWRFYAISSSFDKFSNKDKNLVVQFSVKHEQSIDCGGGYVKLFPSTLKSTDMTGDSEYNIMFGPDICGPGTKKVHVIFQYKGKNLLIKKDIRCKVMWLLLLTSVVKNDFTRNLKYYAYSTTGWRWHPCLHFDC